MTKAIDIITNALESVGVLENSQPVDAYDAQRALSRLNDLLDSWSIQPLYSNTTSEVVFTVLGGQANYTVGPTGDFVTPIVPPYITGGFTRWGGFDYPLDVIDYETYSSIGYKTQPGPWASLVYYDGDGNLEFFPVPSSGEVHLSLPEQAGNFPDLTTDVPLQAGVKKALSYTLAEELADSFGRTLSQQFAMRAAAARRVVKRLNLRIPLLALPNMNGGYGAIMNPPDPDGYQGGNAGDMLNQ